MTADEKKEIKQAVLDEIKAESNDITEIETVSTLDGLTGLPAMQGEKLVTAPLSLLSKPATDAAATANAAAGTANKAADTADKAAQTATNAAATANKAADAANTAANNSNSAASMISTYDDRINLAMNGASARFDGFVEGVNIELMSYTKIDGVFYDTKAKRFCGKSGTHYCNNWAVNNNAHAAEMFLNDNRTAPRKDKIFMCGASLYVWSDEEDNLVEVSGSGSGSGFYNVTNEQPLASGKYYDKDTAIAALENADIKDENKMGMILTFEKSAGVWETRQFVGTSQEQWSNVSYWKDFGGGHIKEIQVNGVNIPASEEGIVNVPIDTVDVDETLDAQSTNAVQNAAVTKELHNLSSRTVAGMDVEIGDENSATLTLTNASGGIIASVDIPAGGGGGGEVATNKIVLLASVDNSLLKEGQSAMLTYRYDHVKVGGDENGQSTGQKAAITVRVQHGSTLLYENTTEETSTGSYTFDLTDYLQAGTNDIYVIAQTTDPDTGKVQRKQAYVSVKVVSLALTTSYDLARSIANGGLSDNDTLTIPYAVSGSGVKNVLLFIDGVQVQQQDVSRSGTTNGSFSFNLTGKAPGRHTVQMVAELKVSDAITLRSQSIYIDVLKQGDNQPFIGAMFVNQDGRIYTAENQQQPVIAASQYDVFSFKYVGYHPTSVRPTLVFSQNGNVIQEVSVSRTSNTWSTRFSMFGMQSMKIVNDGVSYHFVVDVEKSSLDVREATYGLAFKLSPNGRSNGERNPAEWRFGDVQTLFEGFDWSSNGWTGTSLLLTNGARATIGYELFKTDAGITGKTIEIEFKVSNVTNKQQEVISCISGGKGLVISASDASIKTGSIITYQNEDGIDTQREVKIGTKFTSDRWLKVAFVIGKRTDGRLMEIYVNGNRSGSDLYDSAYYFRQEQPVGITLSSDAADLEVRNIRVYDRALNDDEVLENSIFDTDVEQMQARYEENDIMGENGDVDMEKLRKRGKGVLRIVRPGGLDDVFATNNKKTDFRTDIYFYSPFGKSYNFVLRDCNIRIQGTSSTKYPGKNLRIYMAKGGSNLSLEVDGTAVADKKYVMRPGARAMNLFCLKADYSDSSMSMNTGGAKLFNELMKELGLLTPPQQAEFNAGGNSLKNVVSRQSIDGFPIDVFVSETSDGQSKYVGQYNFNNEKSKSGVLFGMASGYEGYDAEVSLTLETLNNTAKLCLFQSDSDEDVAANFDAGLETNVPDDVGWSGMTERQRSAVRRLMGWIRSCVPSGANADNLSTFVSPKFKAEVSQYFNVDHLLTYYIDTDYNLAVDQRAKNMLLRCWDGMIWYLNYYDGDTQRGKRNDCFLVYDYTTNRDTWDAEAGKYAFEGRESWLWNLVLANMQDDLRRCAARYRSVMTPERQLKMLTEEQMGNWSDRAYNKSGYLKYIRPAMMETYGKIWPFIYALQGSNKEFITYFVNNRFALLDAKYGVAGYTSDNVDMYLARTTNDAADRIVITPSEVYAFGWGTNNQPNLGSTGIVEGGVATELSITGAYTVNDPLRLYGASRMRVLDMRGAADHLKNAFDLGKCAVLQELDLSATGTGSTGWWLNIASCRQLRKINLYGQAHAKTGGSASTELDLSAQTKLETLDARGTTIRSVVLAKGAPITKLQLPGSLTSLRLSNLSKLTMEGFSMESYANVQSLVVEDCSLLNWENLLAKLPNVTRLRITGISKEDDGTWLQRMTSYKGVDATGNATDSCALVGTVKLTRYMDDERYAEMQVKFPELDIRQPEYTMIEFDENVATEANISNLDNRTGYKYGNDYVPNGHINNILRKRHRVLAKLTKMPTQEQVMLADKNFTFNREDGEMVYCQLSDADSNLYHDGSGAKLDGSEGEWMIYEPSFWAKGINDYFAGKKYSVYSSLINEPSRPEVDVILRGDLTENVNYFTDRMIALGYGSITESIQTSKGNAVCLVNVRGYKRVRFPAVNSTTKGAVFVNNSGNVISSFKATISFVDGMYLICNIPEDASALYFTINTSVDFDKVVLSNSDKIEDMEPDWVLFDEYLCSVTTAQVVGLKATAMPINRTAGATYSASELRDIVLNSGMNCLDWEMHNRMVHLSYAKYGHRNMQLEVGKKNIYIPSDVPIGLSAKYGMTDTAGYRKLVNIDANVQETKTGYIIDGNFGSKIINEINTQVCLGYENMFVGRTSLINNVFYKNRYYYIYRNKQINVIPLIMYSGWMNSFYHGKWMDTIPVSNNSSATTNTTDYLYLGSAQYGEISVGFRLVGGWGIGDPDMLGISSIWRTADTPNYGTHLAFRGKITEITEPDKFKKVTSV